MIPLSLIDIVHINTDTVLLIPLDLALALLILQ